MISLFAKKFIPDYLNYSSLEVRGKYGILCSLVGIGFNILLFAGKFLAGTISGSIAITADAFNNLSDAGSSVITLAGFKLAAKKPDPNHPYGFGRYEYITGFIVSLAILLMGFELAKSSVEKILHPEEVSFSILSCAILLASILVKVYMSFYNGQYSKKLSSPSMKATSMDSLSDSVATTVVLISSIIGHFLNISIDGWCGLAVAGFILFAGYNAAKDTIDPLLGTPPEKELIDQIESIVLSFDEVVGIHDLFVHDYGPGRLIISLHAEVPSSGDINVLHDALDRAEVELNRQLNCVSTIHMDPVAHDDEETQSKKNQCLDIAHRMDERITIHDFRMVVGPTHTNLIFDAVVPHDCKVSDEEVKETLLSEIKKLPGTCFGVITIDKPVYKM